MKKFVVREGIQINGLELATNADKLLVVGADGIVQYIDKSELDGDYYTQTQLDDFFGGITAITGYNKSDWDGAVSWIADPNNYSQKNHTHNYLSLNGGTLTGDLTFSGGTTRRINLGAGTVIRDNGSGATVISQNMGSIYLRPNGDASTSGEATLNTSGEFIASSFIKVGGTSSQFLMADGSVITNTFSTDSNVLHTTGDETKSGNLTLNDNLQVDGLTKSDGIYSIENGVIEVLNPKGGKLGVPNTSATGAIKITFPVLWTSTMYSFNVDVYSYSGGQCFSALIGGYNHFGSNGSHIPKQTQILTDNLSSDYTIRFGHDGDKACIWIGELDTTWSYLKVVISNFTGRHSATDSRWASGWGISVVEAFDNIQFTLSNNLIASDWNKLKNIPTEFPVADHDHNDLYNTKYEIAGFLTNKSDTSHSHAWTQITGKPTTFPATAHSHAWNDITSKPSTFPATTHSHTWVDITGKPTTFPSTAHSHAWNDITSKPSTFPATNHNHAASDITSGILNKDRVRGIDVPDTRSVPTDPNDIQKEVRFDFKQRTTVGGSPHSTKTYGGLMSMGFYSDDSGGNKHQLFFGESGDKPEISLRVGTVASGWDTWYKLFHSGNLLAGDNIILNEETNGIVSINAERDSKVRSITIQHTSLPEDYTETDVATYLNSIGFSKNDIETLIINVEGGSSGSGGSGSGGSGSGSGDGGVPSSLAWGDITGKPSTFTPSAHNHAVLTPGTGISGATYNGSSVSTFSVAYGTAVNTAAQGNDSRINNGQTAYGWGNHASAGYIKTASNNYATSMVFNSTNGNLVLSGNGTSTLTTNFDSRYLPLTGGTLTDGLGLSWKWSSSSLTGNSIYSYNTSGGFGFGVGSSVSTWFAYSGSSLTRAIDVYNNGSKIELHRPTTISSNLTVTGTITSASKPVVTSVSGTNNVGGMWKGTQTEYDSISTKDANTLYFII